MSSEKLRINEEKLAEFLEQHKRNPENFNEEGNYNPNSYWLAEEIVKFLQFTLLWGVIYFSIISLIFCLLSMFKK
jgi:hypothetical protein